MNTPITITDRTDAARTAIVDADTLSPTVGHWLAADGAMGAPSPIVRALSGALRRGDWTAVHALADFLSFDVSVIA